MGFFDIDRWNEVWQTIQRNKKRSIMTAFGVFWGVFMLAVMLGFGMGFSKFFNSSMGDMSPNSAFLFTNTTSKAYKGMQLGRWWNMTLSDLEQVRRLSGVKYAVPYYWGGDAKVIAGNRSGTFAINTKSPENQKLDPMLVVKGRYISELDEQMVRKVCIIGIDIDRELFPEGNSIGQVVQVNSLYYTVVGVVAPISTTVSFEHRERTLSLPNSLFRQVYDRGNNINAMGITAQDNADITEVEQQCKALIKENHIISPEDKKAISGFNLKENFETMNNLLSGINLLTWIVGLGTLLAGIVGISNIMLVVVRERTQEIGVRRALGARPTTIISQIISESFILTFIAGIFGLAAAVGTLSIADLTLAMKMMQDMGDMPLDPISFQLRFGSAMICAGIVIAGSIIAGIIPAARALTIKAVDALREE